MNAIVIIGMSALTVVAFMVLWYENLLNTPVAMIVSLVLLLAAFGVRTLCLDHETLDYINFLSKWIEHFRGNGGFNALSGSVGNYNLPYLYFLALFSYTNGLDLYLIKFLSILFDVLLAWSSMRLVSLFTKSTTKMLFTYLAVLLLPTVILNGAYWGQCDSIYTAFGVMSIYYAFARRPSASIVCIALSFAFKLQAIFIIPVFFILLYTKRIRLSHFILFPVTYLTCALPAVLLGRPFIETVTLYFDQAGSVGSGLNYNSPSIFALVRGDVDAAFYGNLGTVAAFTFLFIIYILLYVRRKRITDDIILMSVLLFTIAIPFFLPHMHDRYFFPADIFSLMLAIVAPIYIFAPILVGFSSLLGYHAYLYARYILPMSYGTIALAVVIAQLTVGLIYRLYLPNPRN